MARKKQPKRENTPKMQGFIAAVSYTHLTLPTKA